jgi:hypothetical protein
MESGLRHPERLGLRHNLAIAAEPCSRAMRLGVASMLDYHAS